MAKARKRSWRKTPVSIPAHKYGRYVLSVDPGLDFGWALWSIDEWSSCVPPVEVGVVKTRCDDWEQRFYEGQLQVTELLATKRVGLCFCEWPAFFDGAAGSMVAGRGDLGKLYAWVGGVMRTAACLMCSFRAVGVAEWKGQLPKRVVCDRIEQRLGDCSSFSKRTGKNNEGSHDWDAVGIGLWAKGYF